MIGVFKQKSPGNVGILFIFGLLLKMPLFLYPKALVLRETDGHLYRMLIRVLPQDHLLFSVISFMLLYVQALMLNYLMNEYRMMARPNFLPGMALMIVTSLMPEWNYLSSPLLANTFIIWMFILLFKLYNAANARPQVYNIGLIAGVSSYIFFPSTAFVICVLLGLLILKPFRLNEIALFILGWVTLYYFHAVYLYLNDQLSITNFFPHITFTVPRIRSSIPLAAATLLLSIPFIIGGYFVQNHLRKMLIQVRKNWSILLLYLLLAFFVPFINSDLSFHTWILVTVPFTAFHACAYFYPGRQWLPLLLFAASIGYILYQQYGTPTWH